ncbi:hemerythrin domain-containing protein [Actinopolymorpha pittospori]|uniref:Hemerythrin-like domain-containing protein n=1 Tax=Actinopolymorpha pittospori TaxID=648752 RepID=A0A927MPY0_9ACTN|nr:hypothetical protein [Actinopolymorpha pittospori]
MARKQQQDVVDLLVEQHEMIRSLFFRVSDAKGASKRELFQDLVRLLAVHETAEEEVVHPIACREIANGERVVKARLKEEADAKTRLAELYELGVDHPQFDAKLETLANGVLKHADEEEIEFPGLRERMSPEELRKLVGVLETAEATAPTRPHPAAGESAAANTLAGPPIAVFDRVRDRIRDWTEDNT